MELEHINLLSALLGILFTIAIPTVGLWLRYVNKRTKLNHEIEDYCNSCGNYYVMIQMEKDKLFKSHIYNNKQHATNELREKIEEYWECDDDNRCHQIRVELCQINKRELESRIWLQGTNEKETIDEKIIKLLADKRIIELGFSTIPFIIILFVYKEFFINYFIISSFVLFMGYCVYILHNELSRILNLFVEYNNNDKNKIIKSFTHYILFMISSFLLAFALSITFYTTSNDIKIIEYAYPVFVILCTCRFIYRNNPKTLFPFVKAIEGFTFIVLIFAFLRLIAFGIETCTHFGNISFISMNYFYISIPEKIEIYHFILMSSAIWSLLLTYENIKSFRKQ